MQEYLDMWKNGLNFSGRTDRSGFWMAVFLNWVILVILSLLAQIIYPLIYLFGLYLLAIFIPGLSLTVRRLQDSGHRWYCIFLPLIPLVGEITLLVFLLQRSKFPDLCDGPNQYTTH